MPQFVPLWNSHPNIKGDTPVLDKRTYENQCAINMSVAWLRSGMKLNGYTGARSWQKDKPKLPIRAQELADWFNSPHSLLKKAQKFEGKDVFDAIDNKTGIIFFQNYWGPGNQGDHIDLWNGSRLTDWFTWLRIHARVGSLGIHSFTSMSDFEKSQSVLFWELS